MPRFNKYFHSDEFDSFNLVGSGAHMKIKFIEKLTKARIIANIPFIINSGHRTKSRNIFIGGVLNSSHEYFEAADVSVLDSRSRFIILYALIEVGFTRIGINKSFIHVDISSTKTGQVLWLY